MRHEQLYASYPWPRRARGLRSLPRSNIWMLGMISRTAYISGGCDHRGAAPGQACRTRASTSVKTTLVGKYSGHSCKNGCKLACLLRAAMQCHELHCRHGRPVWMRPMKELSSRDLALFCHFMKLPLTAPPVPPQAASLSSLAANFVSSLESQHPSAGTTILRTACKLQVGFMRVQRPANTHQKLLS